jgi:HEAT repeat protein
MVVISMLALVGCGQVPPTLSGGKPVMHWVEVLKTSPDARSRKEAAFKLGNVGPADPAAYPALVDALKDRDARVRCEVILALVKFGSVAQDAVPVLSELCERDRDPQVRSYAARARERIQGGG